MTRSEAQRGSAAVGAEPREPAKNSRAWRQACAEHAQDCFYCGRPLPKRHEHDHFPIPFRLGGTSFVPACTDCHDWKDRVPFVRWPPTMRVRINVPSAWAALWPTSREARIFYAKMLALSYESIAEEDRLLANRAAGERLAIDPTIIPNGLGTDE